jgi:hypothetical protein
MLQTNKTRQLFPHACALGLSFYNTLASIGRCCSGTTSTASSHCKLASAKPIVKLRPKNESLKNICLRFYDKMRHKTNIALSLIARLASLNARLFYAMRTWDQQSLQQYRGDENWQRYPASPRHNACILDGCPSKKLPDWIILQYFSGKLLQERKAPCKPHVQSQQNTIALVLQLWRLIYSRALRAGRSQPSRCGDTDSRSQRRSRDPAGKGLLSQGSARSEYDRGDGWLLGKLPVLPANRRGTDATQPETG